MKSKVYFFNTIITQIKKFIETIAADKVSVHAAQASFFVITSAIPFISLIIAISGAFLPENFKQYIINFTHKSELAEILQFIHDELDSAPNVPLISISAVTALWSTSRGVGAVCEGMETVYHANRKNNIFIKKIKSLFNTLIFIALIIALVAVILFGDFIGRLLGSEISIILMKLRIPIFIAAMTVLFTGFYASIAKRSEYIRVNAIYHIPGAFFSSVGWIVFSYFYSLYIAYFPNASYIYGGLAAVCLIMLWIYFCMIILLMGAEVNKLYFASLKPEKKRKIKAAPK